MMFTTQEFLLVNELTKRALREMNEEQKGRNNFHFCDCQDLYVTLVALYRDENMAFHTLDAALLKVSDTINKMNPVEGNIRMGHLGMSADCKRYGFYIQ